MYKEPFFWTKGVLYKQVLPYKKKRTEPKESMFDVQNLKAHFELTVSVFFLLLQIM